MNRHADVQLPEQAASGRADEVRPGETAAATGRSDKGERTRNRILAHAREVLVHHGFEAVVLRQIAADLDIRIGNLQYYFPTRHDLVVAAISAEIDADLATFDEHDDDDPVQALAAVARAFMKRWRSDAGVVLLVMQYLRTHDAEVAAICRDVYRAFYGRIEALVAEITPGQSSAHYAFQARLITASIDGASMQVEVGDRQAFEDAVVDIVLSIARRTAAPDRAHRR
ncbi:MAG: TetR/AcrR family transcriptional regulator [Actinomycetota bacterium]